MSNDSEKCTAQLYDEKELVEILVVTQKLYKRTMMENSKGDTKIQTARNVDFFCSHVSFVKNWTKHQIVAFVYAMQLRTFRFGQHLPSDDFCVIVSGAVKLVKQFTKVVARS